MADGAVGFSENDEALVKESWQIMKLDIPQYSLAFFSRILELAPAAKGMFSFLRDSVDVPVNNPKLKSHAIIVFKLTCEAAVQLREKGEVVVKDVTLRHLGSVHLRSGVADAHFEVVKEALLATVEEAAGDKWCPQMKAAWARAYDHLAHAIKAQMLLSNTCASD